MNASYEFRVEQAAKNRVAHAIRRIAYAMSPDVASPDGVYAKFDTVFSSDPSPLSACCRKLETEVQITPVDGPSYDHDWEQFEEPRPFVSWAVPLDPRFVVEKTLEGIGVLRVVGIPLLNLEPQTHLSDGVRTLLKNHQPVILDLRDIDYMGSGGLILLCKLAKLVGGSLPLANVHPHALEVLKMVRLTEFFEIHENLESFISQQD